MKTYQIKELLKKELLIIELPEGGEYTLYDDMLYVWDDKTDNHKRFKGSYTLLGKPDEISEEYANDLIQKIEYDFGTCYRHYSDKTVFAKTATESLLSAIESVIFWENPLQSTPPTDDLAFYDSKKERRIAYEKWHEAEQKTFNRNRTIIFKKN